LKFVLYIDDLAFESADDAFTNLKALLEGGVEKRPANVVVYATSNRRHLVKEKFTDRPAGGGVTTGSGDDVRAFDTMQSEMSLSDRFGVTIVFTAPAQDEYLRIAEFIARKNGMLQGDAGGVDTKLFRENALRWERWFNGRSPRTAEQFVSWAASGAAFPWA
jgi:predicted AAA+ superfamily ATPase